MIVKTLLASVCAVALAVPAAAQGISLDQLFGPSGLSGGSANNGSEGLRLDGLAEVTLGDSTLISSPSQRPLITANVLDDRAGADADILNVVLGNHYSNDDNNDAIQLTDLNRLLGNSRDDNNRGALSLDGLAELRLLGGTVVSSDRREPLIAANVLDTDSNDGLTVADVVIGTSRNGSGNDATSDLARALGDVVGAVSDDSRDRSRGLLRLDGLAEVTLGDATIISSGDSTPLLQANVLDRVSSNRTRVARVNLDTNNDNGGGLLRSRNNGASGNASTSANASTSNSTSRDSGLGRTVNRLTSGLLR